MRARWVKPEFFKDKKIAEIGPVPALVYQALWCMADDGGTAPCDPEVIKGEMFTWWSAVGVPEITGALRTLFETRRIVFHRSSDEWFCTIVNWTKHQAVHKPSAFRYSNDRNDFRDAVPEWCGCGEAPDREATGTPHILDSKTPRLHPSSSPARENGAPSAPTDAQLAETLERFGEPTDRARVQAFLESIDPPPRRAAWIGKLDLWTQGYDLPTGPPKVTPIDIAQGLDDYIASEANPRFAANHVRGYVVNAARRRENPETELQPATNGRAPPRGSTIAQRTYANALAALNSPLLPGDG